VTSVEILGVTIANKLSVSDHVRHVIASCAPMLHALRVLRCHGMNDAALKTVYQALVISRLLYATRAWWVFTTAADRQRIAAFIRRGIRAGFCDKKKNMSAVSDLVEDADDALFERAMRDKDHVPQQSFS